MISGTQKTQIKSRRKRLKNADHAVLAGDADGEAAQESGGCVVGMAFHLRRQRQELVRFERPAAQFVGAHEAGDDRGGGTAHAAAQRNAVDQPHGQPVRHAPGLRENAFGRLHDQVSAPGGQRILAEPAHGHADVRLAGRPEPARRLQDHLVAEVHRKPQAIEAGAEIGRRRGHCHLHRIRH